MNLNKCPWRPEGEEAVELGEMGKRLSQMLSGDEGVGSTEACMGPKRSTDFMSGVWG